MIRAILFAAILLAISVGAHAQTQGDPQVPFDKATALGERLSILQMERDALKLEAEIEEAKSEKQKKKNTAAKPDAVSMPTNNAMLAAPGLAAPASLPLRTQPVVEGLRGRGDNIVASISMPDGTLVPARTGSPLPGGLKVVRIDGSGVLVARPGAEPFHLAFAPPPQPAASNPLMPDIRIPFPTPAAAARAAKPIAAANASVTASSLLGSPQSTAAAPARPTLLVPSKSEP
jgi:type IV pilus biogenesis protein PilP